MSQQPPDLIMSEWRPTRGSLHQFARIIGKIRGGYTLKWKHWWHITLSVSARGLTTTPFPVAGQTLELILDLTTHQLAIHSSNGWSTSLPLNGQSAASLCLQISATFAAAGIDMEPDLLATKRVF